MSAPPQVRESGLVGVLVVEPVVHRDGRGFFLESWNEATFAAAGLARPWVQSNHSRSVRGVLRGLHLQCRRPQSKMVRVTRGEVFDVAVDLRRGSPTFLKWTGWQLSEGNFRQLYIPRGFGHGFCVLSDVAELQYRCDELYSREDELVVAWNDPEIGIRWPVESPHLSDRDMAAPPAAECLDRLPTFEGREGAVDGDRGAGR